MVLGNFITVLAAICLFTLPFYAVYRWRHRRHNALAPWQSASHEMEQFLLSRQANWLVFAWAFGEALIWFVIPEFLLLLIIFMRIQRKRELLLYDIYGTAVGAAVAYCINLPVHLISRLPYIQPHMVTQTQAWFDQHGLLGLAYQPFSGVPYKVFTFLAPHYHFFILAFIAVALVVRMARYYLFYTIFRLSYPVVHKWVYRHYVRLALVAIFIFSALLLRVYYNYGG